MVTLHIVLSRNTLLTLLARLRRPTAAFLTNGAITRGANGTKTFPWTYLSYMQSFIKIGVLVLEKNGNEIMTLCNFNKDFFQRTTYSTFSVIFQENLPKTFYSLSKVL